MVDEMERNDLMKAISTLRWDLSIMTNDKLKETKLVLLRCMEKELALLAPGEVKNGILGRR